MSAPTRARGGALHRRRTSAPASTVTSVHELTTADGATVRGVLATVPGARTVVCLMHPRQDVTHHALVPQLLAAGAAVWTQHTRSVNNDLTLVHEQALLDVAAGMVFLREQGYSSIVPLGHSGGGTLFAFYLEQAGLAGADRIATTPGGRPTALADATMPTVDGVVFLAPHPGQGRLLLGCIDPSVADETDPLAAVPELDAFDPRNGFAEPPTSASYSAEFLERYRAAQVARVARLDARAREHLARTAEARAAHKRTGAAADRRRALAPEIITVFRTDADPAHGRPLARPQRPALRLALRRPARPHQLRAGRLRPPDDAGGVALDVVGTELERRLRAVRARGHGTDPVRRAHRRPGGVPVRLPPHGRRPRQHRPHARERARDALRRRDRARANPRATRSPRSEIAAWLGERHELAPPG